jgi:hypothetical protein
VFLLAVGCLGRRPANWPPPAGAVPPAARNRLPARVLALAGAGVIVVVALGAARYGGVTTARAHVSVQADRHARTIVTAYYGACDRRTPPRADLSSASFALKASAGPGGYYRASATTIGPKIYYCPVVGRMATATKECPYAATSCRPPGPLRGSRQVCTRPTTSRGPTARRRKTAAAP